MGKSKAASGQFPARSVGAAWQEVGASFERFCLTAGLQALSQMMAEDAAALCGPRYGHKDGKSGQRWGTTQGKIGFHGGAVALERPRVCQRGGAELALPSWEAAREVHNELIDK